MADVLNDKRKIDCVTLFPFAEDGSFYCVRPGSYKNCDSIEVYEDHGNGAMVPWVQVIKNGQVWIRVQACFCEIIYATIRRPAEKGAGG